MLQVFTNKYVGNLIGKFFLLISFSLIITNVHANHLELEIRIDTMGHVEILGKAKTNSYQKNTPVMALLPIPIALEKDYKINANQNVKIGVTVIGKRYTLLTLIANSSNSPISFEIKKGFSFEETAEGKAKIEVFSGYQHLTAVERGLLKEKFSIHTLDINFQLPRKYDYSEIGLPPSSSIKTKDYQNFSITGIPVPNMNNEKYWIVFPNPITIQKHKALTIILVVGALVSLPFAHMKFLKNNLKRQVYTLITTGAFFSIVVFYAINLAKTTDYYLGIAGLAPYVLYSLVVTVYSLITKPFRIEILGSVYKNQYRVKTAKIFLYKKIENDFELIDDYDDSSTDGDFYFSLLLIKSKKGIFKVKTIMEGAREMETDEFTLSRTQKHEEIVIFINNP